MAEDLKSIIESLLFVSETPLTLEHLNGVVEEADNAAIRAAIDELAAEYARRDGGFLLKQVAGGYQFRTQGRYNEWIKRLVRPSAPRLSKAALETLAIIAYKQPVIRSDIEHIRGVDSGGVLRMLMERKLIRVLGRKEIPGRPLVYATTSHFLEVFELRDLKDLPTPIEIEALSRLRPDRASDTRDCRPSVGQPANPPEPGGEPGDAGDLE
jgi:segregation and condensation protein B